jgi:cardiolipin synthase A/B
MSWWTIYLLGAAVWVGINSVIIVLQRRPAASTIAWLLALVFLPVVGIVLYRIIGPLKLERRKRRRSRAKRIIDEGLRGLAALDESSAEHHQLAMIPVRLGGAPPLRAETVDIYLDGASAFDAILAAVAAARDHVHLEYYIWEPDTIGTRLRDLLVERARAGVAVRLLLDGTGSYKLSRAFLRPLREAGAKVAWFNPVRLFTWRRRRADFRTHRKIAVCDGRVGFTGGMNITDVHSAALFDHYWRDTHLRLSGAAVWPMQRAFFEDWYYAAGELIPVTTENIPPPDHEGEHLVQVVASGPDDTTFELHKVFFAAINQATDRLWLTTPYFVPDDALLTALCTAALRGVDVRVLVPSRGDSRLVDLAARSYFPELLDAGVRVFEYLPRFIHAKTMLGDDDTAIIGTANFDNRSFRLDFEIAAVLFGKSANAQLAAAFEHDCLEAREIEKRGLAGLSFGQRLGEASARLMSPLL